MNCLNATSIKIKFKAWDYQNFREFLLRYYVVLKVNKETSSFCTLYKKLLNLDLFIQKIARLRELIANFEILHKQSLYVTIWMVLDGSQLAVKYKRQRP